MIYSFLMLVVSICLIVRLTGRLDRKLISFDHMKHSMRVSEDNLRSQGKPSLPLWFVRLMSVCYCAFYIVSCIWFNETWFTVLCIIQIILTLYEGEFFYRRYSDIANIDSWSPELPDLFIYKLSANVILDYIHYLIVIVVAIYRLFF